MMKNHERPICHRAEDLVAYLYNEASETDAQDFADHAEQCDACRSELAVFRQVHESILLWRNEALGTFSPVSEAADLVRATSPVMLVQHERKLTALQALREFFNVSPLWLRGATAFAALLLCVLALVVVSRSWKQPALVAKSSTEEKVYTATQLHDAVEKAERAVNEKFSKSAGLSQQSSKVADNQGQVKLPDQQRASRRELASNSVPTRSRHVRGLTRGRAVRDVSFTLRRGEIIGFAGLVGAGRTEVARAVFGADRADAADVRVHGKIAHIKSPGDAVHLGIGYLSEDRKRYGLALGMDVETNIVLAAFRKFLRALGRIDDRRTHEIAQQLVQRLAIKTPSVHQKVRNLSGGTQQKVVVAKWLTANTDILIFDEPTRGIDVGAKNEIYHLLNDLVRQGKAIVMISSELPEILRMSHRIVVMCEGRITGELDGHDATQEQIMTFATMRPSVAKAG